MNSKIQIPAAAEAIAGMWYNPITNHNYLFLPDLITPENGKAYIMQSGSHSPVNLGIILHCRKDGLFLETESNLYEIVVDQETGDKLSIKIGGDNTVSLIRYTHMED